MAGAELAQRAPERSAQRAQLSFDRPAQWLLTLLAALLVLFPLAPILYQSLVDRPLYEAGRHLTLANFTRILSNAEFWGAVGTTAVFVLLATGVSVVFGTVLAVTLTRTDVPGRGILNSLVLVPFYVSPLVLAFAWAIIYGPSGFLTIELRTLGLPTWTLYSVGGLAVVAGVYYVPYTYLYSAGSLALTDPQL